MIDKSNHTKVGKASFLKFTPEKFKNMFRVATVDGKSIEIGDVYNLELCSVPVHILENVQGDYEVVCEFGTEIHEFEGE